MPSPSQLKKRLTQTTWHHFMANSRARTQLKGSADYSAPILKTRRLETRTKHPNSRIIYADDVTVCKDNSAKNVNGKFLIKIFDLKISLVFVRSVTERCLPKKFVQNSG